MSKKTNNMLIVPERCRLGGHELTARTTTITLMSGADSRPVAWTCVRCLRAACWTAHYARHTDPAERGKPIGADELADTRFIRQSSWRATQRAAAWTKRVHFASGWGFDEPDPTPELREARERVRYGVCAHGHPQRPESVYTDSTGRKWCRPCRTEYAARRRAMLTAFG